MRKESSAWAGAGVGLRHVNVALRVIFDRFGGFGLPIDVRFASKATEVVPRCITTRSANGRRWWRVGSRTDHPHERFDLRGLIGKARKFVAHNVLSLFRDGTDNIACRGDCVYQARVLPK